LATPRIRPRLPRKRPEASAMTFPDAPPTLASYGTGGKGPQAAALCRTHPLIWEYRCGACVCPGDMVH
jgi:hypothetical protein